MKNKTLVKTKIVLEDDGKNLILWFWQKTFWIFGYWYPCGCSNCSGGIDKKHLEKISDATVGNVLYDNFITGRL
jgi:hypothetical protein